MTRITAAEYLAMAEDVPKPSKYGNKPVRIDGHRFASQAEGDRYMVHKAMGFPEAFKLQPRFPLVVNGIKICVYVGDFGYRIRLGDLPKNLPSDVQYGLSAPIEVVEEVKGAETREWKIKRNLFQALYPHIELRVIHTGNGKRSKRLRAAPGKATAAKPKPRLNDSPRIS